MRRRITPWLVLVALALPAARAGAIDCRLVQACPSPRLHVYLREGTLAAQCPRYLDIADCTVGQARYRIDGGSPSPLQEGTERERLET